MVEEVRAHVKEMLEAGAIHASQSPWCNAIVLIRKKDGGLHFCIDLCKLNTRTKKDSYPLPHIQETIESLVGAEYFSCLDLKAGFSRLPWTSIKAVYCLHGGKPRNFSVNKCPLGCAMPLQPSRG